MRIKYSPDADVMTIQLRPGKIVDSVDLAEGVIVHLNSRKRPIEIELLDASQIVNLDEVTLDRLAIVPAAQPAARAG